jgi:hypothetical protein
MHTLPGRDKHRKNNSWQDSFGNSKTYVRRICPLVTCRIFRPQS